MDNLTGQQAGLLHHVLAQSQGPRLLIVLGVHLPCPALPRPAAAAPQLQSRAAMSSAFSCLLSL